ncbi:dTDP-glucose 4,6-dehydratase [Gammaproteobacteria bacterium MOLA455]|nr:dTDP-glucose 4,6-dehydratase [Gammaproteobacteria bacterium MOLA455]
MNKPVDKYKPKNILVTGGAGFIGCNYVRYMLANDREIEIVNLDKLTYAGSLENLTDLADKSRHHFIEGDICDRALVNQLLQQHNIDTIVHFAAESHVDRSLTGPAEFITSNIIGTFTLLEAAREFWLQVKGLNQSQCRFHHISTDEVYGTLGASDQPFAESRAYQPNSPYSASKASSDHLVRAWHHSYGLPVTTSNCSNNYGPYQNAEKFIPTVIAACQQRTSIPVYGDGSNIRDWLYVEDHCSGIDTVVRSGQIGETYNIGGNNEWANIEICRKICDLMDQRAMTAGPAQQLIEFVSDRPGHDWRYAVDSTKISNELNWLPRETFESGIIKTLDWYCS